MESKTYVRKYINFGEDLDTHNWLRYSCATLFTSFWNNTNACSVSAKQDVDKWHP